MRDGLNGFCQIELETLNKHIAYGIELGEDPYEAIADRCLEKNIINIRGKIY